MKRFLVEYDNTNKLYGMDDLENIDWTHVVSVTERSLMTREQVAERFPELKIPTERIRASMTQELDTQPAIPEATMAEAQMAKAHFPYRRVWIYQENGQWGVIIRATAFLANNLASKGCPVFEVNGK